ncbi:hypothetical protein MTO96_051393 [Rhipicephalus appendiculatus]
MPPWRVPATNGLHTSFEGVVMLALHYRGLLTTKTSRWNPRNLQPARNAALAGSGSPVPAENTASTSHPSSCMPIPPAQKPVIAPTSDNNKPTNCHSYSNAAR